MENATAFILAGGKSSRMGSPKAALKFHGQTLLASALQLAASVTGDVRIVGLPPATSGLLPPVPLIADVFPDCGPLGGIHAALLAAGNELNLVLPVDMPFLTREFLLHLLCRAAASDATVATVRVGQRLQPLCAVYRPGFLPRATEALGAGRFRVDALLFPHDTLILEEPELERLSFPARMFENLNTREDYERARSMAGELNGCKQS